MVRAVQPSKAMFGLGLGRDTTDNRGSGFRGAVTVILPVLRDPLDLNAPGPYFFIMGSLRPLRGILFVYEAVRLLALIGVFVYRGPVGEPFPWLACLAPNALFPLMALFFWIGGAAYGVYAPLYTAGKVVSAVTALGWAVLFLGSLRAAQTGGMNGEGSLALLGGALFVITGDFLSAAAGLWMTGRLKTAEPAGHPADKGGN